MGWTPGTLIATLVKQGNGNQGFVRHRSFHPALHANMYVGACRLCHGRIDGTTLTCDDLVTLPVVIEHQPRPISPIHLSVTFLAGYLCGKGQAIHTTQGLAVRRFVVVPGFVCVAASTNDRPQGLTRVIEGVDLTFPWRLYFNPLTIRPSLPFAYVTGSILREI